jgi:hypothetical protein
MFYHHELLNQSIFSPFPHLKSEILCEKPNVEPDKKNQRTIHFLVNNKSICINDNGEFLWSYHGRQRFNIGWSCKNDFEEIGFGFSFTFNTILFCRRLIGFVNNGSIRPIIGWIEA